MENLSDDSIGAARGIITNSLPDRTERVFVLERLLTSVDLANSIAPNAWSVTLFDNGFRLNVGQVEAFVFLGGQLRVNFVGIPGVPPFVGTDFVVAGYRSLPQPLCAFVGSVKMFATIDSSLRQSHEQFIKLAATTRSGRPRNGTRFRDSHCEALIRYARSAIAELENDPLDVLQNPPSEKEYFELEAPKAREGYEFDRRILARGRNANLAAKRKRMDDYTCQTCGFKLELDGKFVIEVHHAQPLAATGESETSIEQLISLCPTCHRIAHLRNPPYGVGEIREIVGRMRRITGETE